MPRHVHAYLYVRPAKDLVMGLSAHDQTFALRVDLKEITELWIAEVGDFGEHYTFWFP